MPQGHAQKPQQEADPKQAQLQRSFMQQLTYQDIPGLPPQQQVYLYQLTQHPDQIQPQASLTPTSNQSN